MFLFEYEKDNGRKIRTDPQASREEALNGTLLVQFSGVNLLRAPVSYLQGASRDTTCNMLPHVTCNHM